MSDQDVPTPNDSQYRRLNLAQSGVYVFQQFRSYSTPSGRGNGRRSKELSVLLHTIAKSKAGGSGVHGNHATRADCTAFPLFMSTSSSDGKLRTSKQYKVHLENNAITCSTPVYSSVEHYRVFDLTRSPHSEVLNK